MAKNQAAASGGVGFSGLLALLFIGLKLGGVIDWPWLWVLSPIWIPVAVLLAIAAFAFAVAGVLHLAGK